MESNGYIHRLKIWPKYFDSVLSGAKTFEFRKDDGEIRFQKGHRLLLEEWHPDEEGYSGRSVTVTVTYIVRDDDDGIVPAGYCIMGLR